MENFIKQLFYGQLNINEQKFIPSLELKNLYKKLDTDDKIIFSNYIEIYQNISCENEERAFIQGFKVGAKLTLQMFIDCD